MLDMDQKKTMGYSEADRSIDLTELSVVLAVKSNDPSIINPDFLRYNAIVDANLPPIQGSFITTPVFSQVSFEGGFTVRADPEHIIFEQTGSPLTEEDIRCGGMAKRYLEKVPQVSCKAIGINPKGFRKVSSVAREKVSNALREGGSWASFKDVGPEIHLRATYRYERRIIILDISDMTMPESGGSETPGMMFQANIHRDIYETNQQKYVDTLFAILASWREDLEDFRRLVNKFDPQRFES